MTESEDLRQFIRDLTLRFERATQALSADIREEVRAARDELALHREDSRRYFEVQNAKLDEVIGENRAQTQALLHILDRLGNGGGAAPAT